MDYHKQKDYKVISQKLPIFTAIFLAIIVIGFITLKEPKLKYALNIEQAWKSAVEDKSAIRPEQAFEILNASDSSYYRFIDIRTPTEFMNSHIKGAINIPLHQILDDEVKDIFKQDEKINILYGSHHREACAPVVLLKELGYKNNTLLLGGFSFYKENILNEYQPQAGNYLDEKAAFDYKKIMNSAKSSGGTVSAAPTKTPPVKKKKKVAEEEGGC